MCQTNFYKKFETNFLIKNILFRNLAVYGIISKSTLEPDRKQMSIWRMLNACWKTKVTNTHSEYVILIAFPQQQRLYESASILHDKICCLSCYFVVSQEKRTIYENF